MAAVADDIPEIPGHYIAFVFVTHSAYQDADQANGKADHYYGAGQF
jgi:hypothetical protein